MKDGNLPQLEIMHLPNDHTAGGRAGAWTPRAFMADNDLALGRLVEALSNSPYWRDTVVFVVEDDAQAGPDHVDSHRAPFYVISAYNRPGTIHRFVNTTDVVAAVEDILGLDRLSKWDYFSRSSPTCLRQRQISHRTLRFSRRPIGMRARRKRRQQRCPRELTSPPIGSTISFNRILWLIVKGNDQVPAAHANGPLHVFQLSH